MRSFCGYPFLVEPVKKETKGKTPHFFGFPIFETPPLQTERHAGANHFSPAKDAERVAKEGLAFERSLGPDAWLDHGLAHALYFQGGTRIAVTRGKPLVGFLRRSRCFVFFAGYSAGEKRLEEAEKFLKQRSGTWLKEAGRISWDLRSISLLFGIQVTGLKHNMSGASQYKARHSLMETEMTCFLDGRHCQCHADGSIR